jgi:hypothetical protein
LAATANKIIPARQKGIFLIIALLRYRLARKTRRCPT